MPNRNRHAVEAFAAMSADEQLEYVKSTMRHSCGRRDAPDHSSKHMVIPSGSTLRNGSAWNVGCTLLAPITRTCTRASTPSS
jgi:hypothetical protein